MRLIPPLILAFLATAVAIRAFAYPGESALEKLEYQTFDSAFPAMTAPITWREPRVLEYITSPERTSPDEVLLAGEHRLDSPGCWPAAGKAICGAYDPKLHLLAFFHSGCCMSNAVMYDPAAPSFALPHRDLSDLRTVTGLRIGAAATTVEQRLGTPSVFHAVANARTIYAYFYRARPHQCEGYWIVFVLDARKHVIGIEDTHGC
jgi:hypothetical protein